jgi:signal transduction histidine kinase
VPRALLLTTAAAVYVVLWVALWHLASAAALTTGTAVWYPPAALTFSLLAMFGPGWAWLPLLASLVAGRDLWQEALTLFEIAGSLSHVGSYLLAALAFRMSTPPPRIALTPRTLSRFLLAGLSGALFSAVLGTLNHQLAGLAGTLPTGRAVVAWFAGDALGIASLAPFLVFSLLPWHRRLSRPDNWRLLQPYGYALVGDLVAIAGLTFAVGLVAWMADVEIVPVSALAAGGTLIILAGWRMPRQSLTTVAVVMSALAVAMLFVPNPRDLIESGLVMLVSSLLALVTTQQTVALRRERLRRASLARQIAEARREHDATAEQLERMKTRIAEVGHELRTPLNAIIGFAGLIRMTAGKADTSATVERAETIEHSGEFLLLLINDIVDETSLRLGRLSLQIQPTDPAEPLDAVARMLAHRAATKDQTLDVKVATPLPPMMADPLRLKQILMNLVQNAIKYSPRGVPILLSAQLEKSADAVRFSVVDEGPGLSQDDLELALQPFTRVGDADREGGSGIGLPLAMQLVQEMGGVADVDSAPARGTAFHIRLPVATANDRPHYPL